mmetsp:Transcript_25732/g.55366  ORF Transcript_25732/g.55366 Transcript_25732/m.55366 type:complete len:318 (+) Transcript_25732:763-1716(+)
MSIAKVVANLVHLCREIITPLVRVHAIPRINVRVRNSTHDIWRQAVHDVIGEVICICPKDSFDLGSHRIAEDSVTLSHIVIHLDGHDSVHNARGSILRVRVHIPINHGVEIELAMRTRSVLGLEVHGIATRSKDFVAEIGRCVGIRTIVTHDLDCENRLIIRLEMTTELAEVALLLGGALVSVVLEVAAEKAQSLAGYDGRTFALHVDRAIGHDRAARNLDVVIPGSESVCPSAPLRVLDFVEFTIGSADVESPVGPPVARLARAAVFGIVLDFLEVEREVLIVFEDAVVVDVAPANGRSGFGGVGDDGREEDGCEM